ncbi:hypothetical protein TWF281_011210 [Arthrobotrys megalospora]
MSIRSLFALSLFLFSNCAAANGPLQERSGCNGDNLLRALRNRKYSSSASIFCSEWLQSSATTVFVTATLSVTATSTPEVDFVFETDTITLTEVDTTFTTIFPTAVNTFVKRVDVPYPPWLAATYPASRVSSACSCFVTLPSGGAFTATATVATQTNTETETLAPITNTETAFVTQTASATATSVIEGGPVPCGVVGCTDGDGFLDQSVGSGLTDCKTFCQSTPSCQSFQFGSVDAGTVCNIFDTDVADAYANGFSTDVNCQQFMFYDPRCIV